ncbi:hypothetical protein Afil01_62010 [Actinorhabdospora filicis]|uniref:Uncharacterized protein n=1 Tax=Actinorhabdospora filicis TaxID=1785913 RepID=A0A9W6WC84_9ACTN|nr:hypothetical protein Afil01_62010 [Actinorhabdospora filicis]
MTALTRDHCFTKSGDAVYVVRNGKVIPVVIDSIERDRAEVSTEDGRRLTVLISEDIYSDAQEIGRWP